MLSNYIDGNTFYTIAFGLLFLYMSWIHKGAQKDWETPPYPVSAGLAAFGTAVLSLLALGAFFIGIAIKIFYYFVG